MDQPSATPPAQKKGRTLGEDVFDIGTYIGLQGIINGVVSIGFVDWVLNSWPKRPPVEQEKMASKKVYDAIERGTESLSKPLQGLLGKNEKTLINGAMEFKGAIKYTRRVVQGGVFGIGGWLTLPFIKKLEDNKVPIVNSVNRTFTEDQSDDYKNRSTLGDDTKQTWAGLLGGRAISFILPITMAPTIIDFVNKHTGRDIFDSMTDFTRDTLKIKPEKFVKGMTAERGKQISHMTSAELFFTAVAVSILYVGSKAISRAFPDKAAPHTRNNAEDNDFPVAPAGLAVPQEKLSVATMPEKQPDAPTSMIYQAAMENRVTPAALEQVHG